MTLRQLNCVVVGDGTVGKTCLLVTYSKDEFPEEYVPTIFDNYETVIEYSEKEYRLSLWDTAGQEEFDKMRTLCYDKADVFLICFSIVNPDSYVNVTQKWIPELNESNEGEQSDIPRLLVGLKTDLRHDEETIEVLKSTRNKYPTNYEDGMNLVRDEDNQLYGYVECSALKREGIDIVFIAAVEAAVEKTGRLSFLLSEEKGSGGGKKDGDANNCCIVL